MKIDVKIDNNTLEQYDKVLSTHKEWKSFYRDIKLSSLLEGKSIQLDLENINKLGTVENTDSISSVVFIINSLSFIIKDNYIKKLTLEVDFIQSTLGKSIKNMYDSNVELEVKQILTDSNLHFILKLPK